MLTRLIIVLVVILVAYGAFFFLKRGQLRRAREASLTNNGLQFIINTQYIVYFYSDGCSQCKSAQKPALERLMKTFNRQKIELIMLRVEDNSELARSWAVRTLPVTIYYR